MTAIEYINSLKPELARRFAPGCIYHGQNGAMRLAREVGYGLGGLEGAEKIIQSLYSDILVRYTFTSRGGVPVDAGPWLAELQGSMQAAIKDLVWPIT